MTEIQQPGSASAQLKDLMMQRLNDGLGLAAKAAGQQAGTLAQAVRQTGEEMREQGQDGQGKMADRIAQPIQRLSGTLSQADPQVITDVKAVRPKVSEQTQQLKAQAASQLKTQTQTRTSAAADGVNAAAAGARQVGEQLRAQGQQAPALVMDALAERIEPVGSYLSSADPDQLRRDVAAYRQKAQAKVSTAADKVNQKQQAATVKVTQAAKTTATRVQAQPALPIAGALSVAAVVAVRMRKAAKAKAQQPEPADATTLPAGPGEYAEVPEPAMPGEGVADDRWNLTRSQLRDQATAAGLNPNPDMTKRELIEALDSVTSR